MATTDTVRDLTVDEQRLLGDLAHDCPLVDVCFSENAKQWLLVGRVDGVTQVRASGFLWRALKSFRHSYTVAQAAGLIPARKEGNARSQPSGLRRL